MTLTLRLTKGKALTYAELDANFTSIVAGTAATVANLAALRALSKLTTSEAIVQGSVTVGDGGGGTYSFNPADTTSADNGTTLIVGADGGRWYITPFPTTGTIASAATTDIGTLPGAIVTVSGAVTITAFGDTMPIGTSKVLQILSSGLSITPSANLILSTGFLAGSARGYLSTVNDRIKVDCIGTNAGHNVYFCYVMPFAGTSYQENSYSNQHQNFSFIPGANTHGGLTAHPATAIDVQYATVMFLATNGDMNQVGTRTARTLRLTNVDSQGGTIANYTSVPFGIHSDINVNAATVVNGSGIITAGGIDTGALAINTNYYLYCVSDGVNWAYVWSVNPNFPTITNFPNYIYAALCGWNHSNGAGSFWQLQKVNNTYTFVNSGNNYPTLASGSNAGVPTSTTVLPFVSPQAYRIYVNLKSATASTTISVAANNTAPVNMCTIAQPGTATQMRVTFPLGLESAFIYYACNDAAGEARIVGFEDVI